MKIRKRSNRLLGIDYGRAKIGLAIATTSLAEPYKVIRYTKEEEIFQQLDELVQKEQIHQIVIGVSEGKMEQETKEFGNKLQVKLNIPVVYQDETLSTQDAQSMSITAGIKRSKRKTLEDAYAAAVMLQSYLDYNY